ncbi:hypothetical protein [Allokutzneria sp. NRRL B-24872]|nr:hypothetical protein [Allokutzneria sp. NRRL B-24872]
MSSSRRCQPGYAGPLDTWAYGRPARLVNNSPYAVEIRLNRYLCTS